MIRILYDGTGKYGRYQVIEREYNDRPSRLLVGEDASPQSGMALDDDPELLFDYNQRLLEVILSIAPTSVLIIGGGAFTLQNAIAQRLSGIQLDTVEIDPILPKIARKFFGLRRRRNLSVITQDGRTYIDHCHKQYDLIIIDAFSGYEVPRSLITTEAIAQYARLLAPSGTIALNIIAGYRGPKPTLTHQLTAGFEKHFSTIQVYPADPADNHFKSQNLIFVASHSPTLSLDYVQSSPVQPHTLRNPVQPLRDSDR